MLMVAVGLYASFDKSLSSGISYSMTAASSIAVVVLAYCAKCPGKRKCVHIIPGLIARHLNRPVKPYTPFEYGVTALAFAALAIAPQPSIIHRTKLLIIFWILAIVAAGDIVLVVCRHCHNVFCPLNRTVHPRNVNTTSEKE